MADTYILVVGGSQGPDLTKIADNKCWLQDYFCERFERVDTYGAYILKVGRGKVWMVATYNRHVRQWDEGHLLYDTFETFPEFSNQPFQIGDKVLVKATVTFEYWTSWKSFAFECVHSAGEETSYRNMYRHPRHLVGGPFEGWVVGYTFRQTGRHEGGSAPTMDIRDNGEMPYFVPDRYHKVWLVVRNIRHGKAIEVLEEDMEMIG